MPDFAINMPATVSTTFENGDGPISGVADVAVTATNRRTGATVETGTASETPAGSGNYAFTVPAADLTEPMRLKVVFQSVASGLYAEAFFSVGDVPDWMRTKRQIRQRVAKLLHGPLAAWDMRATGGSDTTAVLPHLNFGGTDEFSGLWARFSDGVNAGQDRRILSYDDDTDTVTFGPAVAAAVADGDRVELYRLPGSAYDEAIERAVGDIADTVLVPFEERVIAGDGATLEFTLPSDAVYVNRLTLWEGDTLLGDIPKAWYALLPDRRLLIAEGGRWEPETNPLRFDRDVLTPVRSGWTVGVTGMARIEPPVYDDSWVEVYPAYVEAEAHYQLALMQPDMAAIWPFLERRAKQAKKQAMSHLPPNSQRVL